MNSPHQDIKSIELTIDALGRQGDGIGTHEGQRVFVPGSLVGERVRIEKDGNTIKHLDVLSPSPYRDAPDCDKFLSCGGCQLLHHNDQSYQTFKREALISQLESAGMIAPLNLHLCPEILNAAEQHLPD